MNHRIILASTGEEITLGRHVHAIAGPYKGTLWRLDEIRPHEGGHRVHVSRRTPVGRRVAQCPLEWFDLRLEEIITGFRHALSHLHHGWQRADEWLWAGVFALIPLALFEAFHGGEATRQLIEHVFNTGVNTGGH
jgi:hypothetical protein